MSELVFLLEEPSARAMLEGLLPRLLPDGSSVRYIVFEGKSDLEGQMVRHLRHYRVPNARFVVLRDQDAADCHRVKNGLVAKCRQANRPDTLVRIACHELESWYLADLAAVEKAFKVKGLAKEQRRSKYRAPDSLANPAQELTQLTGQCYQKVGGHGPLACGSTPTTRGLGVLRFLWPESDRKLQRIQQLLFAASRELQGARTNEVCDVGANHEFFHSDTGRGDGRCAARPAVLCG